MDTHIYFLKVSFCTSTFKSFLDNAHILLAVLENCFRDHAIHINVYLPVKLNKSEIMFDFIFKSRGESLKQNSDK